MKNLAYSPIGTEFAEGIFVNGTSYLGSLSYMNIFKHDGCKIFKPDTVKEIHVHGLETEIAHYSSEKIKAHNRGELVPAYLKYKDVHHKDYYHRQTTNDGELFILKNPIEVSSFIPASRSKSDWQIHFDLSEVSRFQDFLKKLTNYGLSEEDVKFMEEHLLRQLFQKREL